MKQPPKMVKPRYTQQCQLDPQPLFISRVVQKYCLFKFPRGQQHIVCHKLLSSNQEQRRVTQQALPIKGEYQQHILRQVQVIAQLNEGVDPMDGIDDVLVAPVDIADHHDLRNGLAD